MTQVQTQANPDVRIATVSDPVTALQRIKLKNQFGYRTDAQIDADFATRQQAQDRINALDARRTEPTAPVPSYRTRGKA